eukprot:SAG22_NODE_1477_length_4328_cov_2.451643_4_plen_70_part_00
MKAVRRRSLLGESTDAVVGAAKQKLAGGAKAAALHVPFADAALVPRVMPSANPHRPPEQQLLAQQGRQR